MTQETKEQATSEQEQEGSEESKNVSTENDETSAESTEKKAEQKEDEESFEEKIDRLAQSKSDKSLNTLNKTNSEQKARIEALEEEINTASWTGGINSLFTEEAETLGEDKAEKNKTIRRNFAEKEKAYHKNHLKVEKQQAEIDEKLPRLQAVERDQMAKDTVWGLLFPEDKKKVAQVTVLVKKFEKAQDMEDYEIVLEGIKAALRSPAKKGFVPDSSQSGASGVDISKLSPAEKVTRTLTKLARKN